MVVEEARLKPGLIPAHKGPARTMSELKMLQNWFIPLPLIYNALVLENPVQHNFLQFNHLFNLWLLSLAICSEVIN